MFNRDENLRCKLFKQIYHAAKEKNDDVLNTLFEKHHSLDVYEDGAFYHFFNDTKLNPWDKSPTPVIDFLNLHIDKITPLALLAYENDKAAVECLIRHQATPAFAAYGYAYKGLAMQVDNLVAVSSMGSRLNEINFALMGFYDSGLANKDYDHLLHLLTHSKLRPLICDSVKQKKLFAFDVDSVLTLAQHLAKLMQKYKLTYEQALTWQQHQDLYYWFRDNVLLGHGVALPLEIVAVIASLIAPNLSIDDATVLYNNMTLDAHRVPLKNELIQYSTDIFNIDRHQQARARALTSNCMNADSTDELAERLKAEKSVPSANVLGFFGIHSVKKAWHDLAQTKTKEDYLDIIDRHLTRMQTRGIGNH